jgi:hypothetical protein
MESQVASFDAGVPAVHESTTDPEMQEAEPVAAQRPIPQAVGEET